MVVLYGCIDAWVCGAWLYGCIGVWVHRCLGVGVWVHGFMGA